ncbi:MAG: hypothetical protein QXW72_06605 [Conexivisphaerales archaeon]
MHKLANQLSDRTNVFEDLRNFKGKIARTKSRIDRIANTII